jgi:hypothetical protein
VYTSHAWITHIAGETGFAIAGTAEQDAEELVKMGQQPTVVREVSQRSR